MNKIDYEIVRVDGKVIGMTCIRLLCKRLNRVDLYEYIIDINAEFRELDDNNYKLKVFHEMVMDLEHKLDMYIHERLVPYEGNKNHSSKSVIDIANVLFRYIKLYPDTIKEINTQLEDILPNKWKSIIGLGDKSLYM